MALDQDSIRFRNDDGSETGASWKEIINLNISVDNSTDTLFRIRFLLQDTGATSNLGSAQLQYNLNSGGWINVTGGSSVVVAETSSNFTDDDNTTQQLGGGVFVAGFLDDVDGSTSGNTYDTSEESEFEFNCRLLSADVSIDDIIELRVSDAGSALSSYTSIAHIEIVGVRIINKKEIEVSSVETLDQIVGILTFNSGNFDFYMMNSLRRPIGAINLIVSGSLDLGNNSVFNHSQSLGIGINTVDSSKTGYLHGIVNELGFSDKHMNTKEVEDFLGTHHMSMKGYSEGVNLPGRTIFGGSSDTNYLQYAFPTISNSGADGFRDYTVYRTNILSDFVGSSTSGLLLDSFMSHNTDHASGAFVTFTWQESETPTHQPYWSGTFFVPSGGVGNYQLDAGYFHVPREEVNYENLTLGVGILNTIPYSSYFGIEVFYPGQDADFYGDLRIHSMTLSGSGLFIPNLFNDNTNLFISGNFIPDSGSFDLFLEGIVPQNSSIPLFITSYIEDSGDFPLFLHSDVAQNMNLFIKVDEPISGVKTMPLYMNATAESGIYNSATLFIDSQNTPSGLMNLYMGGDPVLTSITTNMNLYLQTLGNLDGSATITSELDLYLMNEVSGDNSNIDLFMSGPVGASGFIPVSGVMNLFMSRTTESISHNLPLYMTGPSGENSSFNMFLEGGESGINSNFTMFVSGLVSSDNNIELFARGL